MDDYQKKYIKIIEQEWNSGGGESGLSAIIDEIYQDGYEDGANQQEAEMIEDYKNGNFEKYHLLDKEVYE